MFYRNHILISSSTADSTAIKDKFDHELAARNLSGAVKVITSPDLHESAESLVVVYPEGTYYHGVKVDDVSHIIEEHLLKGRFVKELLHREPEESAIPNLGDLDFFQKQKRLVLRRCGLIDPADIDDYIRTDGYQALARVLKSMAPAEVIAAVKKAGLRGRGGAGFLTGQKWEFCAREPGQEKYLICNADEGDPGAFMDRSILEGDPHSIIEGMIIAAYAIGAAQGYIYIRAEYPLAVRRIKNAIAQAEEYGLLGDNILGSNFSFKLLVKEGAGAFVCGEETALMASIEGHRGMPRPRPPFPAQKGLWGKPTNINNVETFSNVPLILLKGVDFYSAIGTAKSKGTKVFALTGRIKNTGLVEVPMGITLREIIEDIGGGVPENRKFKAAQIGGPSGGCLPRSHLDLPVDYDSLSEAGAIMGSGGLVVMDETTCIVDVARFFLQFTRNESCGKCVPCREGTTRMLEILEGITRGQATLHDLELLERLARVCKSTALCGLGQTAPNPILSTLRYFREEYEEHILQRKCRAGVCSELVRYQIIAERCVGCHACARVCPTGAIRGEKKEPHTIEVLDCIKCGACMEKCRFNAITCS